MLQRVSITTKSHTFTVCLLGFVARQAFTCRCSSITMASNGYRTALASYRAVAQTSSLARAAVRPGAAVAATFSTSACRAALPVGPPPQGYRLPRRRNWDENPESALDKAGKYFLMTEMLRGMWVLMEQFFRPP